jgi:hypothetical protein
MGFSSAVAEKIAKDFDGIHGLHEPEQSLKNGAAAIVAAALETYPPEFAVKVSASGSQGKLDWNKADSPMVNGLKLEIEPLWNFEK